jgi:PAS domain S-box-containing protein
MDAVEKGWSDNEKQAPGWRIERRSIIRSPEVKFFTDNQGQAYERLLNNIPVMLHAMDGSGRIVIANRSWVNALGYKTGEVVGKSFSEFLPPESRSKLVTTIYPKYLVQGECRDEEILMFRKDGSLANIILSITAFRGEKGRLERSICVLEDISQRKIAEFAANRSDQRFKGAFSASIHGMAIVSPTGKIELANAAMKAFLGREDVEQLTTTFDELIDPNDRGQFLNGMGNLLRGDINALQQDIRYVGPGGKSLFGATSVFLVRGENNDIEQLIIQVSDITDRKTIAAKLQKAQKMEALGQLTGGLAHDFNNFLTVIMGHLQLMMDSSPEQAAQHVEQAMSAATNGAELTKRLMAFARQQQLAPQNVRVNSLLQSTAPLLARAVGEAVNVRVVEMAEDARVLIDPSQLQSALINIANHASPAMPRGGTLTIEAQPIYLDTHYAERNPDVAPGNYVMIAVTDTGTGLQSDALETIFQPAFERGAAGVGFGLSAVYGFVKQSGGHVTVYSEVGHGTSFKMYIPRQRDLAEEDHPAPPPQQTQPIAQARADTTIPPALPAQPAQAPVSTPVPQAARRPKLLVVEDQEAVRAVACGFLEDFGYDVIEAGDGFEALSQLQENPDVDLMFSDVVMPGGMNGFDLAQAAKTLKPELKVVHTSGYPKGAMVHQDEPRFKEGFIIMKPYRREDLQKIIKDALESQ